MKEVNNITLLFTVAYKMLIDLGLTTEFNEKLKIFGVEAQDADEYNDLFLKEHELFEATMKRAGFE